MWDYHKSSKIHIIIVQKNERKDIHFSSILKRYWLKIPKFSKWYIATNSIGKQTLSGINPNKSTPRHIIIKMMKTKDKDSKISKRNDTLLIKKQWVSFLKTWWPEKMAHFSSAERKEASVNSVLHEIILKKSRGNKDVIKGKLRDFVSSTPVLEEWLKEAFLTERK